MGDHTSIIAKTKDDTIRVVVGFVGKGAKLSVTYHLVV